MTLSGVKISHGPVNSDWTSATYGVNDTVLL